MHRKLTLFVLALVVVLVAAPVATAQEPVTIQWLEWWEPEWGVDVMNELTGRFEEQTGIRVERTSVPWGNMYENLLTNAQAGTATYDVLGMEACCFLTGINRLGGIEPLGPYLERDPEFVEGLTDLTVVEWLGEPLMLNWYIFPYSYVYNIDIFEAAGLEPPTNWEEAIEVSQALNESDVVEYGLGVGFGAQDLIQVVYYMFGSRLAQLGGRFFDEDGRAVFNSPEGVAALQWWKDLYDSGILAPGALGMSFAQAREFLAAETIAATWEGPFAGVIARQINPDIRIAYPEAWCDVTCGYQWAGSGLAISANSEHKDEAWEFIKFLLSDEISLWLTETNGIPYATDVVFASLEDSDDPILRQIPGMLTGDPEHNLVLAPTPEFELLHGSFVEAFQAVMAGDLEPQEALDQVAEIWNAEIDALR